MHPMSLWRPAHQSASAAESALGNPFCFRLYSRPRFMSEPPRFMSETPKLTSTRICPLKNSAGIQPALSEIQNEFIYVLEDKSADLYKQWSKYYCNDSHKLDKNVDGRTGSILERISYCVADNCSLVRF